MDKKKLILPLIVIFPLVLGLACNMPGRQTESSQDVPPEDLEAALAGELVDDRPGVYTSLGRPDAFDISIVEVEGVPVRMESWRYYQYGAQVDFVDGSALWVSELEPLPDGTILAAWYDPMDFTGGMTAAEAVQLLAASSPAGFTPERIEFAGGEQDLAGGSALVGDQIVIGLYEDQVIYVETIAFIPDGSQQ